MGLIFGGLGFLCWILAVYRVPETRAMTYVELGYLFDNKTNRRRFGQEIAKHREDLARAGGVVDEKAKEGFIVHAESISTPGVTYVSPEN